jgi:hypothetical protein
MVGQGASASSADTARGARSAGGSAHRRARIARARRPLYSDGVVDAPNADGEFFGDERLVDFTLRAELAVLPAPETLRRLAAAVLAHQGGQLQDDATLVLVDWSADTHRRLFPHLS